MCLRGYVGVCVSHCLSVCCLYVCALNVEWGKLFTLISNAVMKEATWTTLSSKMHRPRYGVFLSKIWLYPMNDNYNVTTWLMTENCNNLPHGSIFTTNTCPSKTLLHKAVLIHQYILQTHFISQLCHFPVNFRKCKNQKITRRGKNRYCGHKLFLLPSIISKFRKESWCEILLRHNSQLLLSECPTYAPAIFAPATIAPMKATIAPR